MRRQDIVHLRHPRGDCFLGPRQAFDRRFRHLARPTATQFRDRLRIFIRRQDAMTEMRRLHARHCNGSATAWSLSDQELISALARELTCGRLVLYRGLPTGSGPVRGKGSAAALADLSHLAVGARPTRGVATAGGPAPDVPAGPVSSWSLEQRIERVLQLTQSRLPASMRAEFAELISPVAIGITVGVIIVWVASHGTPVGPAVDIILLLAAIVALGWGVFEAASALYDFIEAIFGANSERDLERAADHLARAIALLGVAAFAALLRKIGRTGRSGSGGKTPDQPADPPQRQRQKSTQSDERKPPAASGPSRTQPTGPLGGKPDGGPKEIPKRASKEAQRGIRRENESAETLAAKGYRVKQLDESTVPGVKNPDFEVEGKTFDALAPKSNNVEQVRSGISDKVGSGQTKRIVLNLDDTHVTPGDVSSILERKPKAGLEEVIGIQNGEIFQIFP